MTSLPATARKAGAAMSMISRLELSIAATTAFT